MRKPAVNLRRRFSDIDRDKVVFWIAVALAAVSVAWGQS